MLRVRRHERHNAANPAHLELPTTIPERGNQAWGLLDTVPVGGPRAGPAGADHDD
jgi:hypothetical protein